MCLLLFASSVEKKDKPGEIKSAKYEVQWSTMEKAVAIGGIVGCVRVCLHAENGATLLVGIERQKKKNKLVE